ncbi:MAG: DUF1616 domain-containing protein [Patescibacteria group bacterium]
MTLPKQLIVLTSVLLCAVLVLLRWYPPFESLRIVGGFTAILFLPGYVWSFVLWENRSVTLFERCVISIALSVVVMPLTILFENKLGIGISVESAVVTVVVMAALGIVTGRVMHRNRKK